MTSLDEQRATMRSLLRQRRAALSDDDQAAAAMAVMVRLAKLPVLQHARAIAGYRGIRGEVEIDGALILLMERGILVTVPRVDGTSMTFHRWDPDAEVIRGAFGIAEPAPGDEVAFGDHDVVLVPLVAFDGTGQRLGQGGGFYDRAIAGAHRRPTLIGVGHAFQRVETVPAEAWDQRLDAVVTEEAVHEFTPGVLGRDAS
ncbi:MAG: 5-formyltetrahydrofolate cyclo-ligase [Actinomycetota bacterium]